MSTRIAYQLPRGGWYLKPYLDLDATYLRTGSCTETSAGALDLDVDSADDIRFAASPMIELGGKLPLQDGVTLRPYASAGTFQARTELPDTLARPNLGLELQATEHTQIKLEYSGELGQDYQGHSGTIRFSYLFRPARTVPPPRAAPRPSDFMQATRG